MTATWFPGVESLPGEEFRPVPAWPAYSISNLGRIISHRRAGDVLLAPGVGAQGYRRVMLKRDGRKAALYVHQVVLLAFVGPRPDGHVIRHLNGEHLDNRLENLAYGTHSENARDRREHGRDANAERTTCRRNHPLDRANTYVNPRGGRVCRICMREAMRAYRRRVRAAARQAA